jgi:hypothetical protein
MAYELKTKVTEVDPVDFFASLDARRRVDSELVDKLLSKLTGQPAKMWSASLVGYGSYDYQYASGHKGTYFRIGFSPRKPAFVIYLISGFDGLQEELAHIGPHRHEKSCLYLKSIDKEKLPALEALAVKSLKIMNEKYPLT